MNKYFQTIFSGSTAVLLATSGTAVADVTAAQVWENWQALTGSYGQTFNVGSETMSGDTLTIKDLAIDFAMSDGASKGTIDELVFKEMGDGTVMFTMSPEYRISVTSAVPDGEAIDIDMAVVHSGLVMLASGTPDNIAYDFTAESISMEMGPFMTNDGNDLKMDMDFTINQIDGRYDTEIGAFNTTDSKLSAANATFSLLMTEPDEGTVVKMNGVYSDLAMDAIATLPTEIDTKNPMWMFGTETDMTGSFSTGSTTFSMAVEDGSDSFQVIGGSGASNLDFSIQNGTIAYGGSAMDTIYSIASPQLPLPSLNLGIKETVFEFAMPMLKSDEPNDMKIVTKLVGLSVDENLWAMIDPGRMLSHDPATLVFDITAGVNWLIDLTDTKAMEMAEENGETPIEVHTADINEINLTIAGAEVSASGAFEFDNTDMVTFDGIPAPSGSLDVSIDGVNGLIDTLIQMGLLPEEQAMGARMMMAMFSKPGEGEDSLVSTIEVTKEGSVLANGQRLR